MCVVLFSTGSCWFPTSGTCGLPMTKIFHTFVLLVRPNQDFFRIVYICFSLMNHHFCFFNTILLPTHHQEWVTRFLNHQLFSATFGGYGIKFRLFQQFCGTVAGQGDKYSFIPFFSNHNCQVIVFGSPVESVVLFLYFYEIGVHSHEPFVGECWSRHLLISWTGMARTLRPLLP